MDNRTDTLVIEAGIFVRRRVINFVTSAAWERGLDCSYERAGRTIRFTVSGDAAKVSNFTLAVGWVFS